MQSFLRRFGFLAFAFLIVSPAAAQATFELTPSYGLVLPQSELCCGGELDFPISQTLEPAPSVGLALAVRSGRFALEGAFVWSPTLQSDDVGIGVDPNGDICGRQTNCTSAALQVPFTNDAQSLLLYTASILWYPGSNPVFEPYLAVGAGGKALAEGDQFGGWEDGTVDLTVGFGGGLRFHYNDQLSIRIDARDWISSFDWDELSEENDLASLNDIVLTTGFSIVLGGN